MKFINKVCLSLVIAVIFELTFFQFPFWASRFDQTSPKDLCYEIKDKAAENSEKEEIVFDNNEDLILNLPCERMRLYYAIAVFPTEPNLDDITLYYQRDDGSLKAVKGDIEKNRVYFSVNKLVESELRLEIDERAKAEINNLLIIVNPTTLDFSVSRIVAVVLIYVCGSLLFRIQRMPDYTKYININNK